MFLLTLTQLQGQTVTEAFSRSYAAESKQNYTEAISAIQTYYNASSYELNLRLGWLFYLDKKYLESVNYYNKAAALKPMATEPLWGIIYPYTSLEKWNGIEQVYRQILKRDPKNSKANYYLGLIFYYRKDYTQARKFFAEVLNLYPFDHDACLYQGWSLYFLGNKAEAKDLFNRALLNQPTDASAREGLNLIK